MLDTKPLLTPTDFPSIYRQQLSVLQVNLGYLCNLSCTHCHVNAGPKRTELMTVEIVSYIEQLLTVREIKTLDLTGGAPEMNPHFKRLVSFARHLGIEVIDRCNLTILEEPHYEDMADFLAENGVTIVASLPCYSEENVREQRGNGVFESSIRVLKKLNALGYGISDNMNDDMDDSKSNLQLHLVYNPNGHFLPPSQQELQSTYKEVLYERYNIRFNQLFAITNMPIKRFGGQLLAKGIYDDYMQLLKDNYASDNLEMLMCKSTLSIDWQGYVYDCDFNQMLDIPTVVDDWITSDRRLHISHIVDNGANWLNHQPIAIGEHCYGCTAGQGSSCGGAL